MNWSEVFCSSEHELRSVDLGGIDHLVSSGFINCQRYNLRMQNRVGLYMHLYSRLDSSSLPHLTSALMHHLDRTMAALNRQMKRSGGGLAHKTLATIATLFLQDRGKSVLHEERCNGRRVDVVSTDYEWLIECGDTNGEPIVKHLNATHGARNCNYVCVLPFQEFIDGVTMYVFTRGSNWSDEEAQRIHLGLNGVRFKELDARP